MNAVAFFTLIIKDFRLKIRNLIPLWVALPLGSIALSFLPEGNGKLPIFLFPILMTAFLSLFDIEWLISHEKEMGTFLLLRTMPISDSLIVGAKIAGLGILLAVHPLAVLPSILIDPINLLSAGITSIFAVFIFCGAIWGMLFFLVFRGANRYVIPLFVILLLSILAMTIMRSFPGLQEFLVELPSRMPPAVFSIPFTALLGWWLTCRLLSHRDSSDLVD